MSSQVPIGLYESAYTMASSGEGLTVVTDRLHFTPIGEAAGFSGVGEPDEDGLTMRVCLVGSEDHLVGGWEERDPTGEVKYKGELEFVRTGLQRYLGVWLSQNTDDRGAWTLVKL